jgi:hypothetical protein
MLIAPLVPVSLHCATVFATHDFLNQQDYCDKLVGQFYSKRTINSETYVLGIVLRMIAKIYQEIDGRFLGCQALCLVVIQTTLNPSPFRILCWKSKLSLIP